MNLKNKNTIKYGAGGLLGSTVAKVLARAGPRFFYGRNLSSVQKAVKNGIK